jgi:Domain of unknown function (DUF1911)/Domain of unknown function (DUF1910)
MIRAPLGSKTYWHDRFEYGKTRLLEEWQRISEPSKNPIYRPQYVLDTGINEIRHLLVGYSFNKSAKDLAQHLLNSLTAWELSNKLAAEICKEHNLKTCRDWDFNLANLNHYNWCFWLVGLAILLEIPEDQWQRLLALIGDAGEDVLLDRVIASREPNRTIGSKLLHEKPYLRLLKSINAPAEQQPALLREFVECWYVELKRPNPKNRKAPTLEPFWYTYGDHNFEGGSYFGRWCIEAAAAVKAFGLDDSLCLGHEHYPGDLLRPDMPSTHPHRAEKSEKSSLFSRIWKSIKT